MKREFLQNFKVGEQALPKEIIDAIMEENGQRHRIREEALCGLRISERTAQGRERRACCV